MVALQIRDVPEDVRNALVERAQSQGQSLQAYLLSLVKADARRSRNQGVLARFDRRTDGSKVSGAETVKELDALRAERDRASGDR
jgi:hypothetical protein